MNLVSERKSLLQKLQKKDYKKYFFGNVRVFTEYLEHPENTLLLDIRCRRNQV